MNIFWINKVWDPGPLVDGPPEPQWVTWETPTDPDPSGTYYPDPFGNGFGACTFFRASKRYDAGSGGADLHAPAIIVGNSLNGDTLDDCHYLDVGDGVQLEAALAAAGAGADIYIRPGTYDLGAGAAVSPLTIPSDVRVRGAGRKHARIRTKSSGDQGAFVVSPGAALENVRIDVATPTDVCSGSTSVVMGMGLFELRDVDIEFESYWNLAEASNAALRSAFMIGTGNYLFPARNSMVVDCRVGVDEWAPSLRYVGMAPGNEFVSFQVGAGAASSRLAVTMDRCFSNGADFAVMSALPVHLTNSDIYGAYLYGAYLTYSSGYGSASYSTISHNHIRLDSDLADARGVLVENLDGVDVAENFFENTYGATGDFAIELIASTNSTLNGNRGNNTIDGAISLDGTSDNNIAIGNNFQGATYSNLGAANDLAHNK